MNAVIFVSFCHYYKKHHCNLRHEMNAWHFISLTYRMFLKVYRCIVLQKTAVEKKLILTSWNAIA